MKTICYLTLLLGFILGSCQNQSGEYVCTPCELECDLLSFSGPGKCPHCNMKLIKKIDLEEEKNLKVGEVSIKNGSGLFLIPGGKGKEGSVIKVYYHQPANFHSESRVLIVLPGAGRNGDDYRDAWVEASEKYGMLILSPGYPDSSYAFTDYHMCGLITDSNFRNSIEYVENTNMVRLDESKLNFKVITDPDLWIFSDFDRIFDLAVDELGSAQTNYDIFGHSAGGQILHRFAIFYPNSKADKILSSNSGFYTLPNIETRLPFGLKKTGVTDNDLKFSFEKKLVLFIGEKDNENEIGGTLLRSESADSQGLHRLERSRYFYEKSMVKARELGVAINWELEVVSGVGHDFKRMSMAAVEYLYETYNATSEKLESRK